jgi:ligand-binding sensor domain-containing protein
VRAIYEDHDGTLWIGTGSPFANDDSGPDEGGLNRLDKGTGKFTRYLHDPKNPNTLIDNRVGAIFEDSRGTFWVGTAGNGLHTMDRRTGRFERHLYDPSHPGKLSRPPLQSGFSYDHIHFITEDVAGSIWIGTVLSGLNRYDPRIGKITHFADNGITGWDAFTSNEGVLWVGSWQGDVYYFDPLQKVISFVSTGYAVRAVCEESKDVFWLGTSKGLIRHDRVTGRTDHFLTDSVNGNNYIESVYRSDQGTLWIGTQSLHLYNQKTNDITDFQHNEKDPESFNGGRIFMISGTRHGILLIGTDNGLDLMNLKTMKFTHYVMNPEDTSSLSQNWVTSVQEDARITCGSELTMEED